ncbi:phage tail tip fiber protein [Providencia rettgeri]|uniref:phage tail tip fiber protein n=1 Tax=Providencia rettgeri TaxID=587 RepID=UPI0032EE4A68
MGKTVTNIVSAGLMVAGVIATGGLGTALIVAGIAVQAAGTMIFKDKMPSMGYRDQSERKQMLRSSTAPETIIVGKTVCSGLLFFAEEEKGDQTENERLFMALAIAAHKVDHIGQIWLNDDLIGTFGDKASYEFHNGRTDCDPYLLKNAPSWKSDMIGDGLAWLRLTLKYDAEKFPYGVPNIKVEVWGKPVYDPRTNKTAWSNNGALIILDFYRSYLGVPDSDIDFDAFKIAADLCSEPVTTPEGNTEPRYTINGAYELSESPSAILDHMHKCIAAEPTYVAGKHGILMQAYNGPAVLRIEPNQIIDTVNITPELSLRDATNAIYGTFVDAEQQYIKTDFEPVIVDEWIEEDGLEIKENMDYRFVTSPYQAARLSNLYLRKKRAGRRVQLRMNMDGYAYRPGEVILLNLPQIGIQNLEFRVAEWKFHPQEGVDILLEEDGAYIYEDIIGKPFVRPPFTVLPTGGVAPPLNLAFVATNIGEVVQGYLSWQSAAADVRYNTVNIIENSKVIQSIQVPQDRVDLSGLVRGSYRAEVRSINAAGAMSAPAIVDFDIQAPPKPVSVEMVGGMFSLTCIPHGGETAQHGYTFEFWFSDKKLASTNDTEVTTKANRQGQGQFWTKENLKADTNYWFYIRTVNSYGKSQFVEAVGQASGTPKDMIDELGNNFLSTEAGQQMQEQIDFNQGNVQLQLEQAAEATLNNTMMLNQVSWRLFEEEGTRKSEIFRLEQVRVSDQEALARWQQQVKTDYEQTSSAVLKVQESLSTLEESTAKDISQVKAEIKQVDDKLGPMDARITDQSEAIAKIDETQTKHIETAESRFNDNEALINQLSRTIANAESSLAEMGMQLTAEYGNQSVEQLRIKASITRLDTVTANKFQSFAQSIEKLETQFNDVNATITTLKKTVSDNEKSQAEVNELVKSEIGENKAAIEKRAETSVDQQGNSRAYFSIKAGVLHNGQYYDVKMMMSAQVKNGQVVTQIAFAADEFIIFNNANGQFVTPFAVVNGQVFIGSGFIQDGSITNAKIGNVIQSNDFKKGEKGWQIDKNGNPEFNDGTFRGKVYANGGEFNGTVYVEKLIGDNATATVYKEATKDEIHGNRYDQVIETSVIYVGGMPYDIDLLMPTMQFESSCSTSTGIKAAYVQVIIDGVTYTPQTTTIVGDDTSFWNLICSLYVTIPATKKDVKVTVRYTTNHENRCTTKIKPAMIIACKHNSSSFKFS